MKIVSNTALSIDGKISTYRNEHFSLGSEHDRSRMSALRAKADAVLVGGRTFRNWPYPLIENKKHGSWKTRENPMLNVVLTRQGINEKEIAFQGWPREDVNLIFCADENACFDNNMLKVTSAKVERFSENLIINTLKLLEERGCEFLLVEAGGSLLFELFSKNLIQEMYITLCPFIVGGSSAPTLSDGLGFDEKTLKEFRLKSEEALGDELYLHYIVR